jgi:hypothetical protein
VANRATFLEKEFYVPEHRVKLTLQASRGPVRCHDGESHLVLRVQRIIVEELRIGLGTAVLAELRTLAKQVMGRCLSVESANERLCPLLAKMGAVQAYPDAEHTFCRFSVEPEKKEVERFFNLDAIVAYARDRGQDEFGHTKKWSDKF